MDINASISKAKEIGTWVHGKTFNISVPSDKHTLMGASLLQHALDVTDAIIILLDQKLPGPAFALFRPLHEAYTRAVWLLQHASDEDVAKFEAGKYPGFKDMLRDIGDAPETGGAYIKGMSERNREDFHGLTHGGMEHVLRRVSTTAVEPNYPPEEIQKLLRARNQYSILSACFLLQLANDETGMNELLEKQNEWRDVL